MLKDKMENRDGLSVCTGGGVCALKYSDVCDVICSVSQYCESTVITNLPMMPDVLQNYTVRRSKCAIGRGLKISFLRLRMYIQHMHTHAHVSANHMPD